MATEVLFIEYPKCSTCKKAKKWLDDHGVSYFDRHIVEDNPQAAEIADWQERSGLPVRRFFNTSGMKYRELGVAAANGVLLSPVPYENLIFSVGVFHKTDELPVISGSP